MDLCIGLVVFVVVMLLFVGLGHGIWMILAAMWNTASGSERIPSEEPPSRPDRRRACPACNFELNPNELRCPECGLPRNGRLAGQLERLRDAQDEVVKLAHLGELDSETSNK